MSAIIDTYTRETTQAIIDTFIEHTEHYHYHGRVYDQIGNGRMLDGSWDVGFGLKVGQIATNFFRSVFCSFWLGELNPVLSKDKFSVQIILNSSRFVPFGANLAQ